MRMHACYTVTALRWWGGSDVCKVDLVILQVCLFSSPLLLASVRLPVIPCCAVCLFVQDDQAAVSINNTGLLTRSLRGHVLHRAASAYWLRCMASSALLAHPASASATSRLASASAFCCAFRMAASALRLQAALLFGVPSVSKNRQIEVLPAQLLHCAVGMSCIEVEAR